MKKEVLVFIFDGYADWEISYACPEINVSDKYEIKTVSCDKKVKKSLGGLKITPDYDFKSVPRKPAMLILPGGKPWLEGKNDGVKEIVSGFIRKKVPVAAICDATIFMARSGWLDKLCHTGNSLEYTIKNAPEYKGRKQYKKYQAVSDGGIITANGTAALEFAAEIMLKLKVMSEDDVCVWYSFMKKGYYKK